MRSGTRPATTAERRRGRQCRGRSRDVRATTVTVMDVITSHYERDQRRDHSSNLDHGPDHVLMVRDHVPLWTSHHGRDHVPSWTRSRPVMDVIKDTASDVPAPTLVRG